MRAAPDLCTLVGFGPGAGRAGGAEFISIRPTMRATMMSTPETKQPHPLRNMLWLPIVPPLFPWCVHGIVPACAPWRLIRYTNGRARRGSHALVSLPAHGTLPAPPP